MGATLAMHVRTRSRGSNDAQALFTFRNRLSSNYYIVFGDLDAATHKIKLYHFYNGKSDTLQTSSGIIPSKNILVCHILIIELLIHGRCLE